MLSAAFLFFPLFLFIPWFVYLFVGFSFIHHARESREPIALFDKTLPRFIARKRVAAVRNCSVLRLLPPSPLSSLVSYLYVMRKKVM